MAITNAEIAAVVAEINSLSRIKGIEFIEREFRCPYNPDIPPHSIFLEGFQAGYMELARESVKKLKQNKKGGSQ